MKKYKPLERNKTCTIYNLPTNQKIWRIRDTQGKISGNGLYLKLWNRLFQNICLIAKMNKLKGNFFFLLMEDANYINMM